MTAAEHFVLVIYQDFWYFFMIEKGGNMGKIKKCIVLISAVFCLYGCAAVLLGVGAGVGIGTYKFIEGQLVREYPLPYSRAWDATNGALTRLKMSVSHSMDQGREGKIDAVKQDGTKVTVKLLDRGQGVTTIYVRVGVLGDQTEARKVHDEIASVAGI